MSVFLGHNYPKDFNVDELILVCTHFREYLQIINTYSCSILHLYIYIGINENELKSTFPNISTIETDILNTFLCKE